MTNEEMDESSWRRAHWRSEPMTRFQVRNRADGDVDIRALTSGEIMPETCPAAYWRAEGCDDPTCEWLLPDAPWVPAGDLTPWVPAGDLTPEELDDIEASARADVPVLVAEIRRLWLQVEDLTALLKVHGTLNKMDADIDEADAALRGES